MRIGQKPDMNTIEKTGSKVQRNLIAILMILVDL
jgi:hypothetical protein